MEDIKFLKLIPFSIIFLCLILIPLLKLSFGYNLRFLRNIFLKTLASYIILSFVCIIIFSMVYSAIFGIDLEKFNQQYPYGITDYNDTEKQEIIGEIFHFKGIDISKYKNNLYHPIFYLLIDLIYYSAMTFFTIGYDDITMTGICRIFPMLESAIGVGFTTIYISLLVIKHTHIEDNDKFEIIKTRISRGWDVLTYEIETIDHVLFFFKSKRIFLLLINSNNEVKPYYLNANEYYVKFLDGFQIKWDFNSNFNTKYFSKFSKYLFKKYYNKVDFFDIASKLLELENTDIDNYIKMFFNLIDSIINDDSAYSILGYEDKNYLL